MIKQQAMWKRKNKKITCFDALFTAAWRALEYLLFIFDFIGLVTMAKVTIDGA